MKSKLQILIMILLVKNFVRNRKILLRYVSTFLFAVYVFICIIVFCLESNELEPFNAQSIFVDLVRMNNSIILKKILKIMNKAFLKSHPFEVTSEKLQFFM